MALKFPPEVLTLEPLRGVVTRSHHVKQPVVMSFILKYAFSAAFPKARLAVCEIVYLRVLQSVTETSYATLAWPLFKDIYDTLLLEFNVRSQSPLDEFI